LAEPLPQGTGAGDGRVVASASPVPAVLEVVGISKTFPGQKALDGVDLEVRAGEVHALLGENGSGKSTLIKILAGIYLPDLGGVVRVRGEHLPFGSASASFAMGLRFVHQQLTVIPQMNAVENFGLEAGFERSARIDWAAQERLTRDLLGRLGIEMDVWKALRDCKPVERTAVAIARALRDAGDGEGEPAIPLIVLDEPTSSLPAAEVRRLLGLIRDIAASGVAVVYVSHRLDEVMEVADRISVLRDGKLQATAERERVSRERVVELIVGREVLGTDEQAALPRPAAARAGTALSVRDLRVNRVRGVSFEVDAGEILGVVGVTGSGRELLGRAIVGSLSEVVEGRIEVEGQPLSSITPAAALRHGLVLAPGNTQPHSAIGRLDARENMTLASLDRYTRLGTVRRRQERRSAGEWMERLDIRPRDPNQLYEHLSGGNQQKLIFAKWLSANPKILVLDEPTAGVDVGARQAIYEIVRESAAEGLAVVVCSSDLEDITSLCRRVLVLREGRVAGELGAEELSAERLLLETTGGAGVEVAG
jgi:ribose transport system ATP-binding protein